VTTTIILDANERKTPLTTKCASCQHRDDPPWSCDRHDRVIAALTGRKGQHERLIVTVCSGYTPVGEMAA
jgi:hypothetical protein